MYTLSFHLPNTASVAEDAVIGFIVAFIYLGIGYLLKRRPAIGRWLAVVVTGIMTLLAASGPSVRELPALAVNLVILGLVLTNWKRLARRSGSQVGA
jgi:hypothetical protein